MSQTTTVGFDPGTQHLMPQLQGQVQQQQQQQLLGQGQYAQVQVQHEEVAPMSAVAAVRAALNRGGGGGGHQIHQQPEQHQTYYQTEEQQVYYQTVTTDGGTEHDVKRLIDSYGGDVKHYVAPTISMPQKRNGHHTGFVTSMLDSLPPLNPPANAIKGKNIPKAKCDQSIH
jgi:hypothetical protein